MLQEENKRSSAGCIVPVICSLLNVQLDCVLYFSSDTGSDYWGWAQWSWEGVRWGFDACHIANTRTQKYRWIHPSLYAGTALVASTPDKYLLPMQKNVARRPGVMKKPEDMSAPVITADHRGQHPLHVLIYHIDRCTLKELVNDDAS